MEFLWKDIEEKVDLCIAFAAGGLLLGRGELVTWLLVLAVEVSLLFDSLAMRRRDLIDIVSCSGSISKFCFEMRSNVTKLAFRGGEPSRYLADMSQDVWRQKRYIETGV